MTSLKLPFQIVPSAVVVFEGLDSTGKTTQHERMERAALGMGHGTTPVFDPVPKFLHMPSGGDVIGDHIYELTERHGKALDPTARQLLHLASHAQALKATIQPALAQGQPVFLDRWWWSTAAYSEASLPRNTAARVIGMAQHVWRLVEPSIIFLFMEPHRHDKHNTDALAGAYRNLFNSYRSDTNVYLVPKANEGEQAEFILGKMVERGIYKNKNGA